MPTRPLFDDSNLGHKTNFKSNTKIETILYRLISDKNDKRSTVI